MATSSSSCVIISQSSARPSTKFQATLTWNPISSRLALSKHKTDESSFWALSKKTLQYSYRDTRKSFVVYANTVPGVPPAASGPPSSSGKPMSWIISLFVSFILPLFGSKLGPLGLIKSKLENAVQSVENIVEAVEHVAENVDKMAEDFADDLPPGKLRDLIEKVENLAEKTAKTADCLDDVIDRVQEAGDKVDDIVEDAIKDAKTKSTSPKAAAAASPAPAPAPAPVKKEN